MAHLPSLKFILVRIRGYARQKIGGVFLLLKDLFHFFLYLLTYFLTKIFLSLPTLLLTSYSLLLTSLSTLKSWLTAKLIWGRGRLFRLFTHLGILGLAAATILSGGFLSGTPLVRRAEGFSQTDYLTTADVLKATPTPATSTPDRPRHEPVEYAVLVGDTLTQIGSFFRVSVDAIVYANNLNDEDALKPGQKLVIPPIEGVLYTVRKSDTLNSISKRFKVATQAIAEFNYILNDEDLLVGQKIVLPEAEVPQIPKNFVPPPLASVSRLSPVPLTAYRQTGVASSVEGSSGVFGWPANGRKLNQYFTRYHLGIDIDGNIGDPIFASDGGVVLRSGWWLGGFGNAVKIDHGHGYTTSYGHLSKINVSIGQKVEKGQLIGEMGSTGRSTGAHLHFGVQKDGRWLNPLNVF